MGDGSALDSTCYRILIHSPLLCVRSIDMGSSMEQDRHPVHKHTGVPFDADINHWNDKKSKHIFYRIGFDFCPVDFRNRLYGCFDEAER